MTTTTDFINFNYKGSFDNKKLGHVSRKLTGSSRWTKIILPNYFNIWNNTKKLERNIDLKKYLKVMGKCVD